MTVATSARRGACLLAASVLALLVACTPRPENQPRPAPGAPASPPPVPATPDADSTAADAAPVAEAPVADAAPGAGEERPRTLAGSVDLFARDLDRQLAARTGNLFYSPFSVAAALSMVRAGARGATAEQIARVLHLDPGDRSADRRFAELARKLVSKPGGKAPELAIANRLWPDRGARLLPAFVKLTKDDYAAPVEQLDFQHQPDPARRTINSWVDQQTHHRIPDLLPPGSVDASTRMVLTNAVYLKAAWETPFSRSRTRDAPFYVDGTHETKLPTMQARLAARHGQLGAAEVAELPYLHEKGGPELSMVIILPKRRTGIAAVEQELDQRGFSAYVDALTEGGDLRLSLPRFKATMRVELEFALAKLGMPLAFARGADFSGMFAAGAAYHIDQVYHQAFVKTDEAGTEAAAATGITMRYTVILEVQDFRVDHPFLFFIRDARSGVILFAGRIENPAG